MPKLPLAFRRVRALRMMNSKITGRKRPQIAEEFGVSIDTVDRELDWALREGLLQTAEDNILRDLVPKAITQLGKALENGDTAVALEVLKGTGLLSKKDRPLQPSSVDEETLEIHVRKRYGGGNERTQFKPAASRRIAAGGPPALGDGSVLEGAIIRSAPAAPGVELARDENRATDDEPNLGIPNHSEGLPPEPPPAEQDGERDSDD